MSASSRAARWLLLLALGCSDERSRAPAEPEPTSAPAPQDAHELAGSWTGTAVVDGKAVALAATVRADGTGVATGVVSGGRRSEAFAIERWTGAELAVRDDAGRLWRAEARREGDTLRVRVPRLGEVVLSRR